MKPKSHHLRRKKRIRKKIFGTAERPRLAVHKSLKNMIAQVIDDTTGNVLIYASTLSKELDGKLEEGDKKFAANQLGLLVATKCKAAQIERVVFDRSGFPYQGRIAEVANGAREGGLHF